MITIKDCLNYEFSKEAFLINDLDRGSLKNLLNIVYLFPTFV